MWFHSKERPEVSQVNANFVDIVFLFDYPFEKTFLRVIMKKELQSGIFFIFIFTLLAACSNDPRTPNTPPPTTSSGWSQSSGLSKGVFYALAADPTNQNIIYAATSTLSVFKTTDGGLSWVPASQGLPSQAVRSLLVDPLNPLKIFAAVAGGELYKTNDGGASWQVVGSGLSQTTAYAVALNPYAPPSGFQVVAGDTINTLSWNAVPNATAYRLYFLDCSLCTTLPPAFDSATWQKVDLTDPTQFSYIHKNLNNGTPYYYVLTALIGQEETTTSAMISSKPTPTVLNPTPPPAPEGLTVTAGDGQNTLRWNVVSGAATYNVYRQATPNVDVTLNQNSIATGLTSTTFTDTKSPSNPLPSPSYYVVTAVVNGTETAKSTEVSASQKRMTALYVGTGGGGIFSSGPAGEFRRTSNSGLDSDGVDGLDVSTLLIDPTVLHTAPPTLYAGTRGGFYRSVDGGDSWLPHNTGLTMPAILSLAQGSGGLLYAGTPAGIFKGVADGSANWVSIGVPAMGSVTSIAVDPVDAQTIYATSATGGIFKSTDGGTTWSTINQGLTTTDIRSILVHPKNKNLIYAGGVGTLFQSTDGGGRWTPIDLGSLDNVANPLPTASVKSIISGSNGILYSGGSAGVFKSVDQGKSWTLMNTRLASGEVQALVTDPSQPGVVYAAIAGFGIYKSLDGGGSWRDTNGPSFVTSLVIDPNQPSHLYAGTSGAGVVRGTVGLDGHLSWSPMNAQLPTRGVNSLALVPGSGQGSSPTLYAGMFQNGLFKVLDDGSDTWTRVSNDLSDRTINALAVHPDLPSVLFAGITRGLYKSGNAGVNLSPISDLAKFNIYFITFDPAVAPLGAGMYVGTDSGVFKSVNQGDNWSPLNDGMSSPVYAVLVDPQQSNIVYAGTVATGIYRRTQ